MVDLNLLQLLLTFIAGLLGVAVGFGALRNQVKTNMKDIRHLKDQWIAFGGNPGGDPVYIKRGECVERHKLLTKELKSIKEQNDKQVRATAGLQNFARWLLTKKEGLSITEVDQIINGE